MARANKRYPPASESVPRRRGVLWWFRRAILCGAVLAWLLIAWLFYFAFTPLLIPETARQLQVGPGASYRSVARQLINSGVLYERFSFMVLGRIQGRWGIIRA